MADHAAGTYRKDSTDIKRAPWTQPDNMDRNVKTVQIQTETQCFKAMLILFKKATMVLRVPILRLTSPRLHETCMGTKSQCNPEIHRDYRA